MTTITETMTGEQIVDLCRRHTLFEWSAQSAVDPIPVARAKGIYFWTPEGKRFIDFNSQLMCVNIGHGDQRVIRAIQEQAATLAYANPFMATEVRARLSVKLAELTPGDIDAFFFTNGGAEANENAIRIARMFTGRHKIAARYRSYHGGTAGALTPSRVPPRRGAGPGRPWGVAASPLPVRTPGGADTGWDETAQRRPLREQRLLRWDYLQQPSARLRCGAGNDCGIRRRSPHRKRAKHGGSDARPARRSGASPPVGGCDAQDRALRDRGV